MMDHVVEHRTETDLVVAALLGDLRAFDDLARRYRVAVFAVARQFVGSDEDAEDIAQEALLLAFKALPQLEHPKRFGGWLFAITRNHALRHATRSNRTVLKPVSEIDALILTHSPSVTLRPSEVFERNETRRSVQQMVSELKSEFRIVLQLRYWSGMSLAEIGGFLALPVSTVKWRLHKARRLIKQQFEELQGGR